MAFLCRQSLRVRRNFVGIFKQSIAKIQTEVPNEMTSSLGRFHFSDKINENERKILLSDLTLHDDFIALEEEIILLTEIDVYLKRTGMQYDHINNELCGYHESERSKWTTGNSSVVEKMKNFAFPQDMLLFPQVQLIDMARDGHISFRICSDTIAGLSLLSDSVMRFTRDEDEAEFDVLLKRRTLFVMKGKARHDFAHEVLPDGSEFKGRKIEVQSQLSVTSGSESNEENEK